ncbi:MAG: response regulator [Terrimicrobiaceae bacterium]|nr:response regulator [Terrimicrobiaceae bacterium]
MKLTTPHRKLLVVDDEPLVRQTLDFCLRDDYDIVAVASGEEAVAAVKKEAYPVVILDLCMEGLSGIETLKRLKEVRETQNVIILTAYQTLESAVSALNMGAFCYLTKPFEQARLREAVTRGFDSFDHQMLREKEMKERLFHVHDAFFSLLCHEFNTPMNIVLGFSDLLASSISDPEQSSWVEEIRKSGSHLHEILMEIVDYTAASHNAVAGKHAAFSPGEFLAPLVALCRSKNIELEISEGFHPSRFLAGPSESVMLIARKLVSMAAHNDSRRVAINTWVDALDSEGRALLHLEVTGTGLSKKSFDPQSLAALFEPYHVSGEKAAGQRMEIGLELATSRKIAEYAGGTVEVFHAENEEFGLLAKIPVQVCRSP